MRVVERHDARRAVRQLIESRLPRAGVELRIAERSERGSVSRDEYPPLERKRMAGLRQARDHGHGRAAAGRRRLECLEHVPAAGEERIVGSFSQDPHRAATDETGVPGQIFRQLIGTQGTAAVRDDLARRDDRVGLHAAAPERAGRAIEVVEHELGAHGLRRAAHRAHHGGQRELAAFVPKREHARVQRHALDLITASRRWFRFQGSGFRGFWGSAARLITRAVRVLLVSISERFEIGALRASAEAAFALNALAQAGLSPLARHPIRAPCITGGPQAHPRRGRRRHP